MSQVRELNIAHDCFKKHWCLRSEAFTGADGLLTAQANGWHIVDWEVNRDCRCRTQEITLYVVTLRLDSKEIEMRIVWNPFIEQYIEHLSTEKPEFIQDKQIEVLAS